MKPAFQRYRSEILILFLLALLPFLFFWRLVTPNPADRLHIAAGDFTEQYFPLRAFAAREWVQGRVPLWNPYLYGGQPALADIQSGALYPPHVLQALLLGWGGPLLGREIGFPLTALEWQVILHFSIAAMGTYLFVRRASARFAGPRQSRFAAVIASLTFTYAGYLTGFPVQQVTILEVSAWLPWVLWGLTVAHQRLQFSSFSPHPSSLLPALAFALAILAGHPQTVLYIFYLSLAYSLFLAVSSPSAASPWKRVALGLLPWLTAVGLGTLLAAAQLLPTLEFIRHSVRAELSYPAVSRGLPLNELISVLYPGYFGGSPEYVGIVGLVLAAAGLALFRPRRPVVFWAGAGLVSLLLAFGGRTFLYPLFYLLAPGFASVRQQERAFLVYSFSLAVLAAFGVLAVTAPPSRGGRTRYRAFFRRLGQVAVAAFGLSAFYIYGATLSTARGDEVNLFYGVLRHHLFGLLMLAGVWLWLTPRARRYHRRPWMVALLAFWLAFNLFTVNWQFNLEKPDGPPPFTPNAVVQFLQANLPTGRIASGGFLPGGHSAAAVFALPDLTGNTPLHLAATEEFFTRLPSWRLWQLMNVRYVVDRRDISGPGLTPVFAEGDLRVYEMGDPFPRAWTVGRVEVLPDRAQMLDRLAADDFDLRTTAAVFAPLSAPLSAAAPAQVQVEQATPTQLTLTVQAEGRRLLVVSQVYYPGWQAEVDGEPARLVPVNGILSGLEITEGRHTVTLVYRPLSFYLGAVLSLVGVVLAAGLSTCFLWRRRRTR